MKWFCLHVVCRERMNNSQALAQASAAGVDSGVSVTHFALCELQTPLHTMWCNPSPSIYSFLLLHPSSRPRCRLALDDHHSRRVRRRRHPWRRFSHVHRYVCCAAGLPALLSYAARRRADCGVMGALRAIPARLPALASPRAPAASLCLCPLALPVRPMFHPW